MDPNEPCRCGHERAFHDSCSKCFCPFFLAKDAPAALAKAWKVERDVRKLRETS